MESSWGLGGIGARAGCPLGVGCASPRVSRAAMASPAEPEPARPAATKWNSTGTAIGTKLRDKTTKPVASASASA